MTRAPVAIFTFDWLPELPRGFVRDLRARWAAEEARVPYRIETFPAAERTAGHLALQPFGQVPVLKDGDLVLFESGAIVLYLTEGTALLPPERRPQITQWLIAALNSIEPITDAWLNKLLAAQLPEVFGPQSPPEVIEYAREKMARRLGALEAQVQGSDWLAGDFSGADIMMVSVLRVAQTMGALTDYPALTAYVARATARPAFIKALADHMAHWQAADAQMAAHA